MPFQQRASKTQLSKAVHTCMHTHTIADTGFLEGGSDIAMCVKKLATMPTFDYNLAHLHLV